MTLEWLRDAPFDRVWPRLTAAEALALLRTLELVPAATALPAEALAPDGLLAALAHNAGQGYLAAESPAVYVGRIYKDPDQPSYAESSSYHAAPWLAAAALRSAYADGYAARLALLRAAGLSDDRIAALASPRPTTVLGSRASAALIWNGDVDQTQGRDRLMPPVTAVPWIDGEPPAGAELRSAADTAARLADVPAGQRCIRPYIDFARRYLDGAWRNILYDGLFVGWDTEPGLWLTAYLAEVLPKWESWLDDWQTEMDLRGVAALDYVVLNGEFDNSFYKIKLGGSQSSLAAPNYQPGRFDEAGNQISSDVRWPDAVPQIGVVTVNGDSLWHMGDNEHAQHWDRWAVNDDVRVMLFNAWLQRHIGAAYAQLATAMRQRPGFAATQMLVYDLGHTAGLTYPAKPGASYDANPLGVGVALDASSAAVYGSAATQRYVWGSGLSHALPQTAWHWLVAGVQLFRSQGVATTKPQAVWQSPKSDINHAAHASDLYQELLLHSLLQSAQPLPVLYAAQAVAADYALWQACLTEFDELAQGAVQRPVAPHSAEFSAPWLQSTIDCGGRLLTRFTPRNEVGWSHTFTSDDAGLTAVVDDGVDTYFVSFPTGRLLTTSATAPAGYWIAQTSLSPQDAAMASTRRIKLTPYVQRYDNATLDGFRLKIYASDAVGMSEKVFRYLERPLRPGQSDRVAVFDGVCSPADLEEMPEDASRLNEEPAWLRLDVVDLVFRSRHDLAAAKTDIVDAVAALVDTLNLMDDLVEAPPVWIGGEPDAESSSSSSFPTSP